MRYSNHLYLLATIIAALAASPYTATAAYCPYIGDEDDFKGRDTAIAVHELKRAKDGTFQAATIQSLAATREIAAYLTFLQLPPMVTNIAVSLRTQLVPYEAGNTLHWGKPWYDVVQRKMLKPDGDENSIAGIRDWSDTAEVSAAYRKAELLKEEFENRFQTYGPMVPYREGKNIAEPHTIDLRIALSDANQCVLGELWIDFYRPAATNTKPNIGNVDGGSNYFGAYLVSQDGSLLTPLTYGSGPEYPKYGAGRRWEYDRAQAQKPTAQFSGTGWLAGGVVVAGKNITYSEVAFYPHLEAPSASIHPDTDRAGGFHLSVRLPKYINRQQTLSYVFVRPVSDTEIEIRYGRGAYQERHIVPISFDPADDAVWD